jgi:predicted ATPase
MLVGRENELNVLNASFRQMLEGKGNILFLTGEAGLGKTTLVHEWWKTVAPDTAIYAEAACSIPIGNVDVGRLEALQPWADIIAQLQSTGGEEKKRLDLKKLIHDAAPAWAWAIPFVGDIAHAAVETHRLVKEQQGETNPNAQNQQQVFQQYVNLISKVAEHAPLVILLDDMHWGDASSTNLLFYLSRQISEKKILVIVTYRPDDALLGTDGKRHPIIQVKNEILRYSVGKELTLQYLDRSAIRSIMQNIFPAYETDDLFENWLRKISDGNSLFVTQFIKTLQEDGHLDSNGVFAGAYDAIKIPGSALAVVEERTLRLDEPTRKLLSYATAEGETFTSYVLEQLSKKDTMTLLEELQQAEHLGVITERGYDRTYANQTTAMFGFSHALFHKALYDTLLDAQKKFLHRKCFDLLKAEWDRLSETNDRTNSLASKLLTHAEKCGEKETAAEVALEAARGSWHAFAETEALEMLGHAKRLSVNAEVPVAVTKKDKLLGEALLLQSKIDILRGRYEDALNEATEADAFFERLQDWKQCIAACNQKASVMCLQSAYERSETEAQSVLALAEKHGDHAGIAASLNIIGNVYSSIGAYEKALEYYARSLEIRESVGDRAGIAGSLNNIGNAHKALGVYEKALEYLVRSLEIQESIGDREGIARTLGNIGNVHWNLGEYQKALEYNARAGDTGIHRRPRGHCEDVGQYRECACLSRRVREGAGILRARAGDTGIHR